MKNVVIGIVIALVGVGSFISGTQIVKWRQYTNDSSYQARQCYGYLSENVFRTPDGKVFNRAQALDYLLANALKK